MASKKAAKGKRSGNGNSNGVPAGYVKVETHLAGFWKPEIPGQAIEGVVGEAVDVKGKDDKINTFYTLKVTGHAAPIRTADDKKIEAESGMMIGVGGKMLLIFLRGREGKEVYITYSGLGPKKAGMNAPKMFETYERPSDE